MIQFTFNDKEYGMIDNWDEMNLNTYIRFMKIQQRNEKVPMGDDLLASASIEALCNEPVGEFDDIEYGLACELTKEFKFLSEIPVSDVRQWEIDGVIYRCHTNLDDISLSDRSDIGHYQIQIKDELDIVPKIASILIRPATKCVSDLGVEYWKLSTRKQVDMVKLEEIVSRSIKISDIYGVCSFFLSGMEESKKNTKDYSLKRVIKSL